MKGTSYCLLEDTFAGSPKIDDLADALDVHPIMMRGHLSTFWSWCLTQTPDGNLAGMTNRAIAKAMGWEGDPVLLVEKLVAHGFLDATDLGLEIHGWMRRCPRFRKAQLKRAERLRKAAGPNQSNQQTLWGVSPDVDALSPLVDDIWRQDQDPDHDLDLDPEEGVQREEGPRDLPRWEPPTAQSVRPHAAPPDKGISEDEWIELWTQHCGGQGRLPPRLFLSGKERATLYALGRPRSFWEPLLQRVASSPWLRGETERSKWCADPGWVLRHWEAILSGRYDGWNDEAPISMAHERAKRANEPKVRGFNLQEQIAAREAAWARYAKEARS